MLQRSFARGYEQLQMRHYKAARKELMEALGLKSLSGFHYLLKGYKETITEEEKQRVETIFFKYGITDVWGGPVINLQRYVSP
ncbi:MAG: hypothetical protein R3Y49_02955 [Rikenellaceae bacterium]